MGYRLRHILLGIDRGNFDIRQIGTTNIAAALDGVRKVNHIGFVLAPRCDFTNNIVKIGNETEVPLSDIGWFLRSRKPADGGIVSQPYEAVVIFNADCPIVVVHEVPSGRLAVLHAGFRCLIPPAQRGSKRDKSIIEALFKDHGFSAKYSEVFVGYGIGPCCFGVTSVEYPEIEDFSQNISLGYATRGPRHGWRSIDLYRLIADQLLAVGVSEKKISIDFTCTSCAGFYEPKYYSACRLGNKWGRNAAIAWLE